MARPGPDVDDLLEGLQEQLPEKVGQRQNYGVVAADGALNIHSGKGKKSQHYNTRMVEKEVTSQFWNKSILPLGDPEKPYCSTLFLSTDGPLKWAFVGINKITLWVLMVKNRGGGGHHKTVSKVLPEKVGLHPFWPIFNASSHAQPPAGPAAEPTPSCRPAPAPQRPSSTAVITCSFECLRLWLSHMAP